MTNLAGGVNVDLLFYITEMSYDVFGCPYVTGSQWKRLHTSV